MLSTPFPFSPSQEQRGTFVNKVLSLMGYFFFVLFFPAGPLPVPTLSNCPRILAGNRPITDAPPGPISGSFRRIPDSAITLGNDKPSAFFYHLLICRGCFPKSRVQTSVPLGLRHRYSPINLNVLNSLVPRRQMTCGSATPFPVFQDSSLVLLPPKSHPTPHGTLPAEGSAPFCLYRLPERLSAPTFPVLGNYRDGPVPTSTFPTHN